MNITCGAAALRRRGYKRRASPAPFKAEPDHPARKCLKFTVVYHRKPFGFSNSVMILLQVHLQKPCYDFYFL